ncbi:LytR C-terminal domain-containing protein [Candidatus Microgenomates bacterium]|nr:LytR C-terminal domain-containing protein [Candidatus Microgenomates bacterium]
MEERATFSRQESLQNIQGGSSRKHLWLAITVVALVLIIGGGVVAYKFTLGKESTEEVVEEVSPTPTLTPEPTPTPTPEITSTPTPTKKPTPTPTKKPSPTPTMGSTQGAATTAAELKRQAISVRVLNGGGVKGAAGSAADYLKGLGYTIESTGNAEKMPDFEKTVIEAKSQETLTLLKEDLGKKYQLGTTSATLSSSASYDAIVTIGKN